LYETALTQVIEAAQVQEQQIDTLPEVTSSSSSSCGLNYYVNKSPLCKLVF